MSTLWGAFMVIILCLPQVYPINGSNINYSPLALGCVLAYAWLVWIFSARKWFRGAVVKEIISLDEELLSVHMKPRNSELVDLGSIYSGPVTNPLG